VARHPSVPLTERRWRIYARTPPVPHMNCRADALAELDATGR